jgi:hypothetical protein
MKLFNKKQNKQKDSLVMAYMLYQAGNSGGYF